MTLHGRIDRIDQRDGQWAILDYKTGDTARTPQETHFKSNEWVDLQLPLYLKLAQTLGIERPLYLYWGVRRPRDLYLTGLPQRWARDHPNFRFVPVISEPGSEDEWKGRTGLVHEAILADFPDLSGFSVYACGSVRMVEAARPAFVAQGLHEDACFSDAFTAAAAAQPPA